MNFFAFQPRFSDLTYGRLVSLMFTVDGCSDEEEVGFLEHVQVETSIRYTNRGALEMHLSSPTGEDFFCYRLTPKV